MKPQRTLARLALPACIGLALAFGTHDRVSAAADWSLFDCHDLDSGAVGTCPDGNFCYNLSDLELNAPRLVKPDASVTAPHSKSTISIREAAGLVPAEYRGFAVPDAHFEYGPDYSYADPSSRYAVDALMKSPGGETGDEADDEDEFEVDESHTADDSDDSADETARDDDEDAESDVDEEEEPRTEEYEIIGMLILEDEASLEDALRAAEVEEDYPSSLFILEDEASLEEALRLLDAAEASDDSVEAAWVTVETRTPVSDDDVTDSDGEDAEEEALKDSEDLRSDEEERFDAEPEDMAHDWLYYDYAYESDYYENADRAADETDSAEAARMDDLYPDTYAVAEKADREDADDSDNAGDPEMAGETGSDYYPDYYEYDHGMFEYVGGTGQDGIDEAPVEEDAAVFEDGTQRDVWAEYARAHQTDDDAASDDNAQGDIIFMDRFDMTDGDVSANRGKPQETAKTPADESDSDGRPGDREPTTDNTPADLRRTDEDADEE